MAKNENEKNKNERRYDFEIFSHIIRNGALFFRKSEYKVRK